MFGPAAAISTYPLDSQNQLRGRRRPCAQGVAILTYPLDSQNPAQYQDGMFSPAVAIQSDGSIFDSRMLHAGAPARTYHNMPGKRDARTVYNQADPVVAQVIM